MGNAGGREAVRLDALGIRPLMHNYSTSGLPPFMEVWEGEYGVTICDDAEKVVRDRHFFRALCRSEYDLFGPEARHLHDEAYNLMDDRYKGSYHRAPDDAGRMKTIRCYYNSLNLPERRLKPQAEIERLRADGIANRHSWSRWEEDNVR